MGLKTWLLAAASSAADYLYSFFPPRDPDGSDDPRCTFRYCNQFKFENTCNSDECCEWHDVCLTTKRMDFVRDFFRDLYDEQFELMERDLIESGIVDAKQYSSSVVSNVIYEEFGAMNIAMPEKSADYWITFVPKNMAPICKVSFPNYASFSSLIAYDLLALPIASVNDLEAAAKINFDSDRMFKNPDGSVTVNLLKNINFDRDETTVLVFRVYRPNQLEIVPEENFPLAVQLISADEIADFDLENDVSDQNWLPLAPREPNVFSYSKIFGDKYNQLASAIIPPIPTFPDSEEPAYNTQFFAPQQFAGVFVNANAKYVMVYPGPDAKCLRVSGTVPRREVHRAFWGFMACDTETSRTVDSAIFQDFGWGNEYTLYAAVTGYEHACPGFDFHNPAHKIVIFDETVTSPWLLARYVLYNEETTDLPQSAIDASNEELKSLSEMTLEKTNGRYTLSMLKIPGLSRVSYFDANGRELHPDGAGGRVGGDHDYVFVHGKHGKLAVSE
eukprot:gene106-624_t